MIVGPEELKFGIHKDQLCAISDYFKAALEGGFQETVRGEVVLKETTARLLDVWVLADYLLAPKLQNFIVDMMEAKHMKRAIPHLHEFGYFYIHTQSEIGRAHV